MPQVKLSRNHLHRSPNGVISFVAGEPTHVPPHMLREVMMIGAEVVDGDTPSLIPEAPQAPAAPAGLDRTDAIKAAFQLIVERNDSADFTGSGRPSVKAVEKITEFDVETKEVADLWDEFKVTLG